MKELTVLSGKGGTGKTSFVAAFAALARGKALADCDVDAADLHLVLEPRVIERTLFRGGLEARIDVGLCESCGDCEERCRFGAVSSVAPSTTPEGGKDGPELNVFSIDPLACEGCGVCAHFCPADAITLSEPVQGEMFLSETRHGPMVHAKLGVAAENSGKLVTQIRQKVRDVAAERGLDLIIVDGSPGIGCPVIASVTGSDLVLIVTEPTLSGRHDLERVVALTGHFGIPAAVAINKFDINEEIALEIEGWCRREKIPLVGKIPYTKGFTAAIIAGRSIVELQEFRGRDAEGAGKPKGVEKAAAAIEKLWARTALLLAETDQ